MKRALDGDGARGSVSHVVAGEGQELRVTLLMALQLSAVLSPKETSLRAEERSMALLIAIQSFKSLDSCLW